MTLNGREFHLRSMRSEDIAEVHALEEHIFPTPWSINSYQFEVEQNKASKPWIIETENELGEGCIAGYIVPWLLVDELHIANIAVSPLYRRLGLARKMLRHSFVQAAREGAVSATLEVRASNAAAQALYTEMGFKEVGRRARYYRDNGEDALLMLLPRLDDQIVQLHLEAN